MSSDRNYSGALTLFRALDSQVRMHILHLLAEQPRCVHELVVILNSSQPLVSQHLKVLKEAGLVVAERQGREMRYSLSGIDAIKIVDTAMDLMSTDEKIGV